MMHKCCICLGNPQPSFFVVLGSKGMEYLPPLWTYGWWCGCDGGGGGGILVLLIVLLPVRGTNRRRDPI